MRIRNRPIFRLVLAGLAVSLVMSTPAPAQDLPSGSAVDQYTEGIPSATGQRKTGPPRLPAQKQEPQPSAVAPSTAAALQSKGKDGSAAGRVAALTAPVKDSGGSTGDGDGMGIFLPLILAATLLAALAIFARRRQDAKSA